MSVEHEIQPVDLDRFLPFGDCIYYDQWKWYYCEDEEEVVRFEFSPQGDLDIIYLYDERANLCSYAVTSMDEIPEELLPLATVSESNIFDRRKYELGRMMGFPGPKRTFTKPRGRVSLDWDCDFRRDLLRSMSIVPVKVLMPKSTSAGSPGAIMRGETWFSLMPELSHAFVFLEFIEGEQYSPCIAFDALFVRQSGGEDIWERAGFLHAFQHNIPIFDVPKRGAVKILNPETREFEHFCNRATMHGEVMQYLMDYWNYPDFREARDKFLNKEEVHEIAVA